MSRFLIKVEGFDKIKWKMDGEHLYGDVLRHHLDTLGQVALGLARGRAPRKSGGLASTLGYEVSKYPIPHWSKVTFTPDIGANIGGRKSGGKPFRFGYALDQGKRSKGPGPYHYRGTGKATFGWLKKIRPLMRGAITGAVSQIAREIEGLWRR